MKIATPKQRLILDAAIDGQSSAARSPRRPATGAAFTAGSSSTPHSKQPSIPLSASGEKPAASPAVPAKARDTRPTPPVTKSVNPPAGRSGTQARAAGAVRRRTNAKLS